MKLRDMIDIKRTNLHSISKGKFQRVFRPMKNLCLSITQCICLPKLIFLVIQLSTFIKALTNLLSGGARGVMVIVVGNGHGNTGSNSGRE